MNYRKPYENNPYTYSQGINKPSITMVINVNVLMEDVFRDKLKQYTTGMITEKQYFDWLDEVAKLVERFRSVK